MGTIVLLKGAIKIHKRDNEVVVKVKYTTRVPQRDATLENKLCALIGNNVRFEYTDTFDGSDYDLVLIPSA